MAEGEKINMDHDLKIKAIEVIHKEVSSLFINMFSVDVELCNNNYNQLDDDTIVAKCALSQSDVTFVLRFAFQRHVISPMLEKLYNDPIMAKHESSMEDAACEISNIICSGLKTFLNKSGYQLQMSLPQIDLNFRSTEGQASDCVGVYFIVQGNTFHIGIEENAEEGEN